jgi:CubicO group peptidase (beta-lactamase class C family)
VLYAHFNKDPITENVCFKVNEPKFAQLMKHLFEPVVEKEMEVHMIPGFCFSVVKDGEMVYSKAFGIKSLRTGERMTVDSLFHMASLTKPLVATSIMQLVEQGEVDLDTPIVEYLPYFRLRDPRYETITVGHMVNHTSGMPDVVDYEWDNPVYDDGALERYVRSLVDEELIATPGEEYHYSNMAYEVLGDLISKVSGDTFEEYVEGHILEPLDMKDSTLLKRRANPELLTTPHVIRNGGVEVSEVFPYNRMHAPSSTLISSVVDMACWANANLNRGKLGSKRILEESSYDLLLKPWGNSQKNGVGWSNREHRGYQTVNHGGHNTGNGVGWFHGEHRGFRVVYHGGRDTGFRSYIALLPEESLGVVGSSNFDQAPIISIAKFALDVLLGFARADSSVYDAS